VSLGGTIYCIVTVVWAFWCFVKEMLDPDYWDYLDTHHEIHPHWVEGHEYE